MVILPARLGSRRKDPTVWETSNPALPWRVKNFLHVKGCEGGFNDGSTNSFMLGAFFACKKGQTQEREQEVLS